MLFLTFSITIEKKKTSRMNNDRPAVREFVDFVIYVFETAGHLSGFIYYIHIVITAELNFSSSDNTVRLHYV